MPSVFIKVNATISSARYFGNHVSWFVQISVSFALKCIINNAILKQTELRHRSKKNLKNLIFKFNTLPAIDNMGHPGIFCDHVIAKTPKVTTIVVLP